MANGDAGFLHRLLPGRIGIDAEHGPAVSHEVARKGAAHDPEADDADLALCLRHNVSPFDAPSVMTHSLAAGLRYYMASDAGNSPVPR
jgi:hypothetical protein